MAARSARGYHPQRDFTTEGSYPKPPHVGSADLRQDEGGFQIRPYGRAREHHPHRDESLSSLDSCTKASTTAYQRADTWVRPYLSTLLAVSTIAYQRADMWVTCGSAPTAGHARVTLTPALSRQGRGGCRGRGG